MNYDESAMQRARKDTVQYIPDARRGESSGSLMDIGAVLDRGALLPAWGTRFRETVLRLMDRDPWLYLWQGAIAGLINRWVSTPWELFGDKEDVSNFQAILQNAQFGAGWSRFIRLIGRDYLRHDIGAFIEIIAPGDPLEPIQTGITGLAHLDALRCYPNRDPEYPVVYYSRDGKRHLMHQTRVYRLVDMPDGDDLYNGVGLSALSRAISILQREIFIGRYIQTKLDDVPPPGIMTVRGLTERAFQNALAGYRSSQQADSRDVFGRTMFLHSVDVNAQVAVDTVSFSQPPEKFDWKTYTELQVNALALALGVDKLDIWEITSSGLGSGSQAEVMAQKAKGRTFGAFLTEMERFLNLMLPHGMDFAFKPKDAEEDKENAQAATAWASAVQVMGAALTTAEARTLLANQIEAVRDAISDAEGGSGRVSDTGEPRAIADDTDTTPIDSAAQQPDQQQVESAGAPTRLDSLIADMQKRQAARSAPVYKGFATTSTEFIGRMASLMSDISIGAIAQSAYQNIVARALYTAGQQAYLDGLLVGGVVQDRLTKDDLARVQAWLADQFTYIDKMVADIWGTRRSQQTPPTQIDYLNRAAMWANKSLREVFQMGTADADRNAMYRWVLGDTREHCKDCLRLNGQIHRWRAWEKAGMLPGSRELECKGYQCRCRLVKTNERARGRLTNSRSKSVSLDYRRQVWNAALYDADNLFNLVQ